MGQILIRNVDEAVLDALRRQAADRGATLQDELTRALAAAVLPPRPEPQRRKVESEPVRKPAQPTGAADNVVHFSAFRHRPFA